MKTILVLSSLFLTACLSAAAQSYKITNSVNLFGDTVIIHQDSHGIKTATVTISKDLFGNRIKTVTDGNGRKVESVKQSKDLFGNDIIDIYDENGMIKPVSKDTKICSVMK